MRDIKVKGELIDNYKEYYNDEISEWRELGAIDKVKNIITLSESIQHNKILEIGCGDGSILNLLSGKSFARRTHSKGFGYSRYTIKSIRSHNSRPLGWQSHRNY